MVHLKTEDQLRAISNVTNSIKYWYHKGNVINVIDGYSGSGKTTIIPDIIKSLGMYPHILTPTNKALSVIRNKMVDSDIEAGYSTNHALLYGRPNKDMVWTPKDEKFYGKAVIIDESSMIPDNILKDLLNKYINSVYVFIGDSFQLEPIGDKCSIFTNYPKTTMTQVCRHDNGILNTANNLRVVDGPQVGLNDDVVLVSASECLYAYAKCLAEGKDSILVCATNKNRVKYNKAFRNALKKPEVIQNDKLISIANTPFFVNGETFELDNPTFLKELTFNIKGNDYKFQVYKTPEYKLILAPDWEDASLPTSVFIENLTTSQLVELFGGNIMIQYGFVKDVVIATWGYAITAQKAQGSQWDDVFIAFDYSAPTWNKNRWLYTAITRAAKKVTFSPSSLIKFI